MKYDVDIDEADVVVLSLNLANSRELLGEISKSLGRVSNKSSRASKQIKPVLRDVNKLNENKKHLEMGLSTLSDVSRHAEMAAEFDSVISNSIEVMGLGRFLDRLQRSKVLLKEMKARIKRFKGIVVNFETSINKADLKVEHYFQKALHSGLPTSGNEVKTIYQFFYENDPEAINKIYVRTQSLQLEDHAKRFEQACYPSRRNSNIPYEKGSNGITKYNEELIRAAKIQFSLMNDISEKVNMTNSLKSQLVRDILMRVLTESYSRILKSYNEFFNTGNLLFNDLFILEVVDCLYKFERFLNVNGLDVRSFSLFRGMYEQLLSTTRELFVALIENVEKRIKGSDKMTDLSITEVVVELFSRLRRLSDYGNSLKRLIAGMPVGTWLNSKPPFRFIGVYTSVIPNVAGDVDELSSEFLISSFCSDYIDAIMVNIEVELKEDDHLKKSVQGYYLIKNLVLLENIVNRSHQFYTILGNAGIERLNKLKKRYLKLFLDDWNYASYIIIRDMTAITANNAGHGGSSSSASVSTSLSGKEREQVKDLFRHFNESFSEALKNYEKFNITDASLRNYLASEIKKLMVSSYFKLYDKYAHTDFTKNKAKYVKYDKRQFELLLNLHVG